MPTKKKEIWLKGKSRTEIREPAGEAKLWGFFH